YLLPGDSPMGYRLPLDSLPWVTRGDYPYQIELDPFAPRGVLPSAAQLRGQYAPHATGGGFAEGGTVGLQGGYPESGTAAAIRGLHEGEAAASDARTNSASAGADRVAPARVGLTDEDLARSPRRFESAHWITRTALVVEVRDPRRANGPKAEA